MHHVETEITSQPSCWRTALETLPRVADALPRAGERVAVIGCGTSWFMAQSYAAAREQAGHGVTDVFPASELPARDYDLVLALTRSGTTTEVVDALRDARQRQPTVAITAVSGQPVDAAADETIVLDFADERSVVQTRFATTALVLLRAHLGLDAERAVRDAEAALAAPLDDALVEAAQITFLGRGWSIGLAHEAALKLREAAGAWSESYPAMEYRHGPISIAAPGRAVWLIGDGPDGLAEQVRATGAHVVADAIDPLADLVRAQRVAVAKAKAAGLDPDRPRHLSRSVILTP